MQSTGEAELSLNLSSSWFQKPWSRIG